MGDELFLARFGTTGLPTGDDVLIMSIHTSQASDVLLAGGYVASEDIVRYATRAGDSFQEWTTLFEAAGNGGSVLALYDDDSGEGLRWWPVEEYDIP